MKMKKIVGLIIMLSMAIVLSSCSQQALNEPTVSSANEPTISSANNTDEQLSEKRQQVIEEGHEVDGYRFRLMQGQYDDDSLIADMDLTVDNNFSKSKHLIDTKTKLSLIPSAANYDLTSQELQLNYFIVNNNIEEITSISIIGTTNFKNQKELLDFDAIVSKEQFTVLKPKEFVLISFAFPMTYNEFSSMQENKSDDYLLTITDLEVNGEKIDNNQ